MIACGCELASFEAHTAERQVRQVHVPGVTLLLFQLQCLGLQRGGLLQVAFGAFQITQSVQCLIDQISDVQFASTLQTLLQQRPCGSSVSRLQSQASELT